MVDEQPKSSKWPSADHLKEHRWKPGQSGNPKGRKPGIDFKALLIKVLEMPAPGQDGKPSKEIVAERLAALMVKYASKGDARFFQMLLDRAFGKVADKIEGGDVPIQCVTYVVGKAPEEGEDGKP